MRRMRIITVSLLLAAVALLVLAQADPNIGAYFMSLGGVLPQSEPESAADPTARALTKMETTMSSMNTKGKGKQVSTQARTQEQEMEREGRGQGDSNGKGKAKGKNK